MPVCWNWQTRWTQNPLPAMACGFDPRHRHHLLSSFFNIDPLALLASFCMGYWFVTVKVSLAGHRYATRFDVVLTVKVSLAGYRYAARFDVVVTVNGIEYVNKKIRYHFVIADFLFCSFISFICHQKLILHKLCLYILCNR